MLCPIRVARKPVALSSIDDLARLTTEASNPASEHLDRLSASQIVELMNREDARVHQAVRQVLPQVAQAVELVADRLRRGGRLIYVGAGTSGRLGVLDAAECPPTFRTPPEMVLGIIAGGPPALVRAVEGLEDHPELGREDLQKVNLSAADVVVGIATSGRTPYVLGALTYAQSLGTATVGLSCNPDPELARVCQVLIVPVVGPEVVSGSTRLKAGTATKMVLNMISTGAMVLLGKTYGNLMVDLKATNQKLRARALRLVKRLTGLESPQAQALLEQCDWEVKTAVVCHHRRVDADQARKLLQQHGGHLRRVIEGPEHTQPPKP